MSRKNSQNLEDRRKRLLQVVEKEFKSGAEFCRNMDLSHNWLNYFKNADDPTISDGILSSLYELKKINPLWITNEVGPYKYFEPDIDNKVTEESPEYGSFLTALSFIEKVEQQADALKDTPLPPDLELRLARLLVRLLERRNAGSDA